MDAAWTIFGHKVNIVWLLIGLGGLVLGHFYRLADRAAVQRNEIQLQLDDIQSRLDDLIPRLLTTEQHDVLKELAGLGDLQAAEILGRRPVEPPLQ